MASFGLMMMFATGELPFQPSPQQASSIAKLADDFRQSKHHFCGTKLRHLAELAPVSLDSLSVATHTAGGATCVIYMIHRVGGGGCGGAVVR